MILFEKKFCIVVAHLLMMAWSKEFNLYISFQKYGCPNQCSQDWIFRKFTFKKLYNRKVAYSKINFFLSEDSRKAAGAALYKLKIKWFILILWKTL